MLLWNGPNTPFGRMAFATAIELGIEIENREINIFVSEFLDEFNPLRQIPTLLLDDGKVVFDSRVIVRHFCDMRPDHEFVLAGQSVDVATRWALATGLMEAAVMKVMELLRPENDRNVELMDKCDRRIRNCVSKLETEASEICQDSPRADRLAVAVALEYLDFRLKPDWRPDAPRLSEWLALERQRPSLVATRPRERTNDMATPHVSTRGLPPTNDGGRRGTPGY